MNPILLEKVLKNIAEGALSRDEAADRLDCSARQVNRMMRRYGVRRPASPVHAARAAAAKRKAVKREKIEQALARGYPAEKAADRAGVSIRTIYRWMALKGTAKPRKKRRN